MVIPYIIFKTKRDWLFFFECEDILRLIAVKKVYEMYYDVIGKP